MLSLEFRSYNLLYKTIRLNRHFLAHLISCRPALENSSKFWGAGGIRTMRFADSKNAVNFWGVGASRGLVRLAF